MLLSSKNGIFTLTISCLDVSFMEHDIYPSMEVCESHCCCDQITDVGFMKDGVGFVEKKFRLFFKGKF